MKTTIPLALGGVLLFATMTGCMTDQRPEIPTNAVERVSGDRRVTFTPQSDGTVWIFDSTNDRIVYSGPVMANASIVIDPQVNAITVDGRIVFDKGLSHNATHKVYFLSNAAASLGM